MTRRFFLGGAASFGYENTECEGDGAATLDAQKVMSQYSAGDCRQGMLVSVYDDCVVFHRREFLSELQVGDDWVLPLPAAESRPFAFAERARKSVAPQFPAGAKIKFSRVMAKTRATNGHPSENKPSVQLEFPAALAGCKARPYEYEVAARAADGSAVVFRVIAEGFNHAAGHRRAKSNSRCVISEDRLPAGVCRFEVTPLDCWWNRGSPLTCEYNGDRFGGTLPSA